MIPESGINLLKSCCEVRVFPRDEVIPRTEMLEGVRWCDGLLCLLTDRINEEVIVTNSNLKVISNYAVGFDNIDIETATKRNIPVTNTPGVLTDAVVEHTIALLISIARRIPESDRFVRAGKYVGWEPLLLLGTELKGKILGIIGLGRIGSGVAERASFGLGMNIIYYDIRRDIEFEKKYYAKHNTIQDIIKTADFISLHVPLLPSTKHLIGEKELMMMKSSAYLINTSRGPVVDEKALVRALGGREIMGAALDVFENEPELTPGLIDLDNIVLTPHTASATYETRSAMADLAASNIIDIFNGRRPRFLVNQEVTIN
jgi:glyoxylate reductase